MQHSVLDELKLRFVEGGSFGILRLRAPLFSSYKLSLEIQAQLCALLLFSFARLGSLLVLLAIVAGLLLLKIDEVALH